MKPPHIKAQRRSETRRIEKKRNQLYRELRNLGYEKLENPIRHGWYRELIITEDVWSYKNAEAILEIYKKIIPAQWGITKEKAQREWDKQCSLFMISRDKPTISTKQFRKLSDAAKHFCVVFRYKTPRGKKKTRFYVNFPKGCIQFQFRRAYITHRRKIDPNLISEIAFLESQLRKKGYYNLYREIHSWDPWWDEWIDIERRKRERKIKENLKLLKRESVEDLMKDNIVWEIN
jgi:hypothetical protein